MGNATMRHEEERRSTGSGFWGFVVRFVVAAVVLLVTSYFVPGFAVKGFMTAIVAAVVISLADYLIEKLFKFDASPFGRGIVGFVVSALILYFAQFFVMGMDVTVWGAVIGALIIGLIDSILPTRFM